MRDYTKDNLINSFTSHLNVLENFDPIYTLDPFAWIPKGIMEDLIDDSPLETIVNDHVTGYSIAQLFGALQSDVTSIPQYKAKLLQLYMEPRNRPK